MAVRASHLASRDLRFETVARRPPSDQRAHERRLAGDVVEVQHADIRLAAVDAWMLREVLRHEPPCRRHARLSRRSALAPVLVSALAEVVTEALAAPVLEPVPEPIELRQRAISTASAAPSQRLR